MDRSLPCACSLQYRLWTSRDPEKDKRLEKMDVDGWMDGWS